MPSKKNQFNKDEDKISKPDSFGKIEPKQKRNT